MTSRNRLHAARTAAARLADLLRAEQHAMADFLAALAALAALDAARAWAELGHASLFAFLHIQLHLSKASAFHRCTAARLVRQFPAVADALREGRLCLTSTAELAKVLTPGNEAAVLPRFFGLSSREAKEVAAELAPHPRPPVREVVTTIAPPRRADVVRAHEPTAAATPRELVGSALDSPTGGVPTSPAASPGDRAAGPNPILETGPAPSATAPAPGTHPEESAVPLTADLRRLHVTVSRRFLRKLEAARQVRAHARPVATTEDLLEEALDLLLAREEKRRTAAAERPLATPRPAGPDHVPAHVRREVWARDEGRCQWPVEGGGICGSTHRPQLDHVQAKARGGEATAANMRVLCESHNKEAARRAFGARWMARFPEEKVRRAG